MDIHRLGFEWDHKRRAIHCRTPASSFPIWADSLRRSSKEIADDEAALRRCPGGRALRSRVRGGNTAAVEFAEGPSAGVIEVELAGTLHLASGSIAAYDPGRG